MADFTLYHGDCLQVMKDIGSVDAVITDPPYGIKLGRNGTGGFGSVSGENYRHRPDWDIEPISKEVIDLVLEKAKDVFIFGGQHYADKLPISPHWLVWDKVGGHQFKNPFSDCELIWTNNKTKKTTKKYVVIQQGFVAEEKERFHPTQKPVKLMKMIIADYTEKGDTILDPFMGSGTTGVACAELGRKFIGIEIDEEYYKIAEKRIKTAYSQQVMF
jgi:DNA modification methylase